MTASALVDLEQQLAVLREAVAELIQIQRAALTVSQAAKPTELDVVLNRLDQLDRRINALEQDAIQRNLAEITVERVNVIEPDGTLRLVISNKERAPDGVINGKVLVKREGGNEAGIIFYNNEGDECGALVFGGKRDSAGSYSAGAGLYFDQFKQDQVIVLEHQDMNGQRFAGYSVWDRPGLPIDEWAERCVPVFDLPDGPEKERAINELRAAGLLAASRLFMGKHDGKAAIILRDGQGRPRLRFEVEAEGDAKLEFLDGSGQVVSRLP